MLKGIKIITEKSNKKPEEEQPQKLETEKSDKEKVNDESKMLSKKREQPETEKKAQSFVNLESFIAEKRKKEEIDFSVEIDKAVQYFFENNNQGFKDVFSKLESFKNTRCNLKHVPKNIIESTEKAENSIYEGARNYIKNKNKTDEELFAEATDYKGQTNFKEKEDFLMEDEEELNEEIENNFINKDIKKELVRMREYQVFDKVIPKKEVENKFQEPQNKTVGEKEFEKLDEIMQKKEDKSKNKKARKRLVVLNSCNRCAGSQVFQHSFISQSESVYVSYPYIEGSLANNHLVISTKEHVNSSASLEENVYDELRNYMKSIVSMNAQNDKLTVFLEHSLHSDEVSHMSIDAIPLKFSLLEDLRLFFKKALLEQDVEWGSNKKIVDTTKYKGNLTKVLSEKFSYVHVDFNAQGGFLHVIEDERRFSSTFLKEILAPFLKKDVSEIKYPKKLSQKELIDKVDECKSSFDSFDWTKYA